MSSEPVTSSKNKKPSSFRKEKRPPKKITESYLHNSGIYYLERFVASKAHFITVMKRKVKRSCLHHTDQDFDKCVEMVICLADKFEDMGLINDALYTNGMVNSLRRRGMSRNAIIQKMRIKGIEPSYTANALDALDTTQFETDKEAEIAAALRLARKKKMGPYQRPTDAADDMKHYQRNLARFARAGFSYDVSKRVMDMTEEDLENDATF